MTATNELEILYLGYIELEVENMGLKIPDCGFLVVRDPPRSETTGNVDMNFISCCRQLVHGKCETTLRGKRDSDWRSVFQQVLID